MFSTDADHAGQFFLSPRIEVAPPGWFGVLYLLRRDIDLCMGIDPNTGQPVRYRAAAKWPGAMAILAGIDLLAKFFYGCDETSKSSERFRLFLDHFFEAVSPNPEHREAVYQLRNALLHSFGLYSRVRNGKEYRFFLTCDGTSDALVSHNPPDQWSVNLRVLHREFENVVEVYRDKLDSAPDLRDKFNRMFGNYGRIYIG